MSDSLARVRLVIPAGVDHARITGPGDCVLRAIDRRCEASVTVRGEAVTIDGPTCEVELVAALFQQLFESAARGEVVSADDVERALDALRVEESCASGHADSAIIAHRGKVVRPKTPGQFRYVDAVRDNTVTFCLGPAGTGKTYLAMAMAVAALKRHEVSRIVLTRPVVEAGENLGFLPGTLEEKVDPYVRPLHDALFDMMDAQKAQELIERGVVEIAPLAYMRGRTLNDSFVILDEAQNTTPEQMKMFLTRLGFNSTFVITGDATQRDLPGRRGGLTDAEEILTGVDDIAFVHLARVDVVRHRLVGKIVEAYEAFDTKRVNWGQAPIDTSAADVEGARKSGCKGRGKRS